MNCLERSEQSNEVLVFGKDAEVRMEDIISEFNGSISMKVATSEKQLFHKLKKHKPPICILEDEMALQSRMGRINKFILADKFGLKDFTWENLVPSKLTQAHEMLPELIKISPETKYVIVSHIKGCGISREDREIYKTFPQVVKVLGFISSKGNWDYLLKLLSRVYLGKPWKSKW